MKIWNKRKILSGFAVAAASAAATLAVANGAAAQPGNFTCSASALRVGDQAMVTANPDGDPCESDNPAPLLVQDVVFPGGTAHLELLTSETTAESRGSSASASGANLILTANGHTVQARALRTDAAVECQNNPQGHPTAQPPTFESSALGVTIDGQTVTPIGHTDVPIPGVGTVHLLHQEQADTERGPRPEEITQSALFFEPAAGTGLPEVAVAEVTADFSGQPCAPGHTK